MQPSLKVKSNIIAVSALLGFVFILDEFFRFRYVFSSGSLPHIFFTNPFIFIATYVFTVLSYVYYINCFEEWDEIQRIRYGLLFMVSAAWVFVSMITMVNVYFKVMS